MALLACFMVALFIHDLYEWIFVLKQILYMAFMNEYLYLNKYYTNVHDLYEWIFVLEQILYMYYIYVL